MNNENRKYDIIVFGASGFTGKLVSEYFLKAKILKIFHGLLLEEMRINLKKYLINTISIIF